jgi:polar amino acid transport system substrate-binding protein
LFQIKRRSGAPCWNAAMRGFPLPNDDYLPGLSRRALCGAGLLAWAGAVQAEPELLRIQTIQSEPFGRLGGQGPSGLMYDIGLLIAQRAGLAADNQVVPYARTVLSLQNGTADMVLRFTNDELKAVAHQVAAVLPLPTVVVSRQDAPVPRLEALWRLSLAVPRSFPMPDKFSAISGLRVQSVNNNEHAIQMLLSRRVDAAYGSNLGLFGAARGLGVPMQAFARPVVVERQSFWLHLARRRATPELIERLARAVESLHRDGSIARLYERALAEFGREHMPD